MKFVSGRGCGSWRGASQCDELNKEKNKEKRSGEFRLEVALGGTTLQERRIEVEVRFVIASLEGALRSARRAEQGEGLTRS